MKLIDYLKPVFLGAGFLFLLAGLNILMIEQPAYNDYVAWLYTLILYTFYLYLVLIFLGMLVMAIEFAQKANANRRAHP